jgi:hypothetical protein
MTIFLERFDSAPLANSDFDYEFNQWISVLIGVLNEVIEDIQNALNLLTAQSYTATEIAALFTAGLPNGIILYDSTNNEYVGQISGVLVKFTTAAYP